MWETRPNDCWVFSKMADLLSLIPWSSTFQDGGWVKFPILGMFDQDVKFPTHVHFNESFSPPSPSRGKPLIGALYVHTVPGELSTAWKLERLDVLLTWNHPNHAKL